MQTRSSKAPDPSLVSMEVDATGAGGATTTTTTANDRDDDPHLIDAVARAASSAPSESLRLAACSELAARCAPLDPRRVLDRVTFDLDWWDHKERSEDVRLERCRLLSAALLVLTLAEKGKTDDIQRKASAPPSSSSPPLPLPAADLLSGRVARCLALSLRDGFHEVALAACAGNSPSLSLDLHDQWVAMEKTAQWRFTPPVHCILAFDQAIEEFLAEGGVAGRGGRYRANCQILVDGLRALGFETLLPDAIQAPIIVTVKMPADPRFDFPAFYDRLSAAGYVIYPGKLTVADSFRIGCIGRLGAAEMQGALGAIREVLADMGGIDCRPG